MKFAPLALLGGCLLLIGCRNDPDTQRARELSRDHRMSEFWTKKKAFDSADARKVEMLMHQAMTAHHIDPKECDWLIAQIQPEDCTLEADSSEKTMLKMDAIVFIIDNSDKQVYLPAQKQKMFDLGQRLLKDAPTEKFLRLTNGLTFIEASGDQRGIAIAKQYLQNPHWSVRKVSKKCVLALNGIHSS